MSIELAKHRHNIRKLNELRQLLHKCKTWEGDDGSVNVDPIRWHLIQKALYADGLTWSCQYCQYGNIGDGCLLPEQNCTDKDRFVPTIGNKPSYI